MKICKNCKHIREDMYGKFCSVTTFFVDINETCDNHTWDGKTSLKQPKKSRSIALEKEYKTLRERGLSICTLCHRIKDISEFMTELENDHKVCRECNKNSIEKGATL